jgi:hypothetical protein
VSDGLVRVGIGTRCVYDGELMQVVEMHSAATGTDVVLRHGSGEGGAVRVALREVLAGDRARVVADDGSGPRADDADDTAGVVLSAMTESERKDLTERAA